MGGVSRCFSKVSGSGVDLTLLTLLGAQKLTRSSLNRVSEGDFSKTNLPFSRLLNVLYLSGENCLQNAHFDKQKGPYLKTPLNWTGSVFPLPTLTLLGPPPIGIVQQVFSPQRCSAHFRRILDAVWNVPLFPIRQDPFWRIFDAFLTHFLDDRQITHLICVRLKHLLCDFFRACFGSSIQENNRREAQNTPQKVI